ncbi:hypothetical protein LEP1GSC107_2422 [Leptospira interrogans serovar Grippotyphosa str. UI 12769]|nr:hypothetical protein LEP1GSC097_0329 [Leptospira interrogans serovar Grippotyphosa str. UI 08368]EMN52449.1 hypothetical protein LEP1GSC089_0981 [Leptospira interrogans serovar Autumnalis str. LP101]EMN72595.1 hypothetical protein LEP1GSC100_1468 [Leptospira interrogans serovar Bataviae str. UI 08561]EMN81274.1 hypothetical protein LEP1GSC106_2576 [Leptospira interrogans serovar Grippotyphosa str. UI 12764]EMN84417.1 hypothetical protein LEP1GSC107_2422 [Leptospira interrogans serovar Grippo
MAMRIILKGILIFKNSFDLFVGNSLELSSKELLYFVINFNFQCVVIA